MATKKKPPEVEWGPPRIDHNSFYRRYPNSRRVDLITGFDELLGALLTSATPLRPDETPDDIRLGRAAEESYRAWERLSTIHGGALIRPSLSGILMSSNATAPSPVAVPEPELRRWIRALRTEARIFNRILAQRRTPEGLIRVPEPRAPRKAPWKKALEQLLEVYEAVLVPEAPATLWVDVGPTVVGGRPMGCYWLGIGKGFLLSAALDEPMQGPYHWRTGYPHPHVSCSGGRICLGDAGPPIAAATSAYDLVTVVRVAADVLNNLGGTPFKSFSDWGDMDTLGCRCPSCRVRGSKNVVINCHSCGRHGCHVCCNGASSLIASCHACKKRTCRDCRKTCLVCSKVYCWECAHSWLPLPDTGRCWECEVGETTMPLARRRQAPNPDAPPSVSLSPTEMLEAARSELEEAGLHPVGMRTSSESASPRPGMFSPEQLREAHETLHRLSGGDNLGPVENLMWPWVAEDPDALLGPLPIRRAGMDFGAVEARMASSIARDVADATNYTP